MFPSRIWFNQGFWFGGAISNSSAWTKDWNVFFSSGLILFILTTSILGAFLVIDRAQQLAAEKQSFFYSSSKSGEYDVEKAEVGLVKLNVNAKLAQNDHAAKKQIEGVQIADSKQQNKKITLWREKLASFTNGVSFSTHVSLLGIQITKLVDIDLYEYTTIVGSLGSMSTILILLSFGFMSRQKGNVSLITATIGHMVGTAILSIPHVYILKSKGLAVLIIAATYALVLISFFITNLSCEVTLGKKSRENGSLAGGKEMGNIKCALSVGKVLGSLLVVVAFRAHPQLSLWILEGLLFVSLLIFSVGHD